MFGLFKPNIEKMERKKDIEGLIKALGYRKDSVVRVKAAMALGRIGGKSILDSLAEALKDEDSNVRKAAEKALSKIKGK
jgi:HEAT repeat protein